MKLYGICIGKYIDERNFMFCRAMSKAEARKSANLYRRQWGLSEPILIIVEIPSSVGDHVEEWRRYALEGAIVSRA